MGRGSGVGGLLAVLAVVLFMGGGGGASPYPASASYATRSFRRLPEATRLKVMAEEFEERVESNIDVSIKRARASGGIDPRAKAIAYKSSLIDKPVKVTTGIYQIR